MTVVMYPSMNMNILIMMSIMIKIAMFPFNYWFSLMSKSINYMNLSILMTLMKFIPMNIMHLTMEMNQFMMLIIMISMIMSPIMKLILSYSSIHQTSLMMMIMYMNFQMFIMYFTLYTVTTMSLMTMLNKMDSKMKYECITNKKMKMMLFMTMTPYSYFPPMTTFIMKWSLIENVILMNKQFKLISVIIMMSSFIMIWSYLNFMNNNVYKYNIFNKMFMKKSMMKLENPLYMTGMILMGSMMYMYINF